jgi:hypothetical protein
MLLERAPAARADQRGALVGVDRGDIGAQLGIGGHRVG